MRQLRDRWRALIGWMRARVLATDGTPKGTSVRVYGRTGRLKARTLETLVQELRPAGPGAIDVRRDADGHWHVRTRGRLASASLEQRVRNVLVNR